MAANDVRLQDDDGGDLATRHRSGAGMGVQQTMSVRLSGDESRIRMVLVALRGMTDVDAVVELGPDAPRQRDDSSSAGLPDDLPSGCQDVQLHVSNSVAYDYVHGRLEAVAADAGVVVEWLDLE